MAWQDYKELIVWQKSMDLVVLTYKLVKLLPSEERYDLSSQMRRAAVSIPSNIAEGKGRMTDREIKHFYLIAQGSNNELETQYIICERLQYLTREQTAPAFALCEEISKMLAAMIIPLRDYTA